MIQGIGSPAPVIAGESVATASCPARLEQCDDIMERIVHFASADTDRLHPTATSLFIIERPANRIPYPWTQVHMKWFKWAQAGRLHELAFNRREHSGDILPTVFSNGYTASKFPDWPRNITCLTVHLSGLSSCGNDAREETIKLVKAMTNLRTVVFTGAPTNAFLLFLIDLLHRRRVEDFRWCKDLGSVQMPRDAQREADMLYPLATGLSAYGLLSVDTLELSGPINAFGVHTGRYSHLAWTVHHAGLHRAANKSKTISNTGHDKVASYGDVKWLPSGLICYGATVFNAIEAMITLETLYLDLMVLTNFRLRTARLVRLRVLRLCVIVKQMPAVPAALLELPDRGTGIDVSLVFLQWRTKFGSLDLQLALQDLDTIASFVAFPLKLYIRVGGMTRMKGCIVSFEDAAEYFGTALGTWKETQRLTVFWDIKEARKWEKATSVVLDTRVDWECFIPLHTYIMH
ncbi:hypothetical protein EV421DRAFT_1737797 [Armillaria borealis]|uniref:Uncharacterized protein n=1 Tax=Armillaria borealis TaxID=47425 RepID=A0AA39MLW0_9AGAR|nr:hypothetical protein EV421DRAFT_1737797 [Armillaria borealis]